MRRKHKNSVVPLKLHSNNATLTLNAGVRTGLTATVHPAGSKATFTYPFCILSPNGYSLKETDTLLLFIPAVIY